MGKSRSKSPKLSMIFSHSVGMINCDNVPVKDKTITGVVSASSNNPDLAEPLIESEDHHTDNPSLHLGLQWTRMPAKRDSIQYPKPKQSHHESWHDPCTSHHLSKSEQNRNITKLKTIIRDFSMMWVKVRLQMSGLHCLGTLILLPCVAFVGHSTLPSLSTKILKKGMMMMMHNQFLDIVLVISQCE